MHWLSGNDKINMNKRIVYFGLGIIIVILTGVSISFSSPKTNNPSIPTVAPSITPYINSQQPKTPTESSPDPVLFDNNQRTFQKIANGEQDKYQQWQKVASLRLLLPYSGQLFTLSFDYSKGSFVLTLNRNNISEGTKEFNAFLKTNGIMDTSWLENTLTQYTQP